MRLHKVPDERQWYLWMGEGHALTFEGPSRWRDGILVRFRYGDAYTDGFGISVGCIWHVYAGWQIPWSWRRKLGRIIPGGWPDWHREFGVRLGFHYGDVQIAYDDSDSSHNRRWQRLPVWRSHWLLGRDSADWGTRRELGTIPIEVGQWDGDTYTATVASRTLVQRNRWRTKYRECYDLDLEDGIPIPGKGENSWDCGDDAIWIVSYEPPMTCTERVALLVEDVMSTRLRHGGTDWRPFSMGSGVRSEE